jgi:tRNA A37 threonylcarbamoyladenosine dehydratase
VTDRLPALDRDDLERYRRHLLLRELGPEGQRRLKGSRVLMVGAGGLGSPAALYLAAAGVGHLTLVDFDVVDLSNLQRQVLHGTADVGRPKAGQRGRWCRIQQRHDQEISSSPVHWIRGWRRGCRGWAASFPRPAAS